MRCTALHRTPSGSLMPVVPVISPGDWSRLRSPVGLSKAVAALLVAGMLVDLVSIVAGQRLRSALADDEARGLPAYYSGDSADADMLYTGVSSVQALALLATAVVFIVWFRRVRLNAGVFDESLQPMKPGWAIGSWFVPIANLWLPFRVARGVWEASARFDADGNWGTETRGTLNRWWAGWIATIALSRVASQVYEQTDTVAGIRGATALYMAADLVNILAAVLAILFVRQLTRLQGERATLGPHPHAPQATPTPLA